MHPPALAAAPRGTAAATRAPARIAIARNKGRAKPRAWPSHQLERGAARGLDRRLVGRASNAPRAVERHIDRPASPRGSNLVRHKPGGFSCSLGLVALPRALELFLHNLFHLAALVTRVICVIGGIERP